MHGPGRVAGSALMVVCIAAAAFGGEEPSGDPARPVITGRACYYSDFFDGRRTANGEIFRQDGYSAAHLTLPLGTWVEVESLATGRKLKLRVNDRGPYSGGFTIDLSRGAARFLGVDKAPDRRVKIRVLAMPGEAPPETEEAVEQRALLTGPSITTLYEAMLRGSRAPCMKGTQ